MQNLEVLNIFQYKFDTIVLGNSFTQALLDRDVTGWCEIAQTSSKFILMMSTSSKGTSCTKSRCNHKVCIKNENVKLKRDFLQLNVVLLEKKERWRWAKSENNAPEGAYYRNKELETTSPILMLDPMWTKATHRIFGASTIAKSFHCIA